MDDVGTTQIGGSHYKSEYQHWTFVLNADLDYFTGNCSKYICRWRKKGGLEDLKKGLSYLNKLAEAVEYLPRARIAYRGYINASTEARRFAQANNLNLLEEHIVHELATWTLPEDLEHIRENILALMDEAEGPLPEPVLKDPEPVPLCEETHYAERAK
jgi:hypothetical protein